MINVVVQITNKMLSQGTSTSSEVLFSFLGWDGVFDHIHFVRKMDMVRKQGKSRCQLASISRGQKPRAARSHHTGSTTLFSPCENKTWFVSKARAVVCLQAKGSPQLFLHRIKPPSIPAHYGVLFALLGWRVRPYLCCTQHNYGSFFCPKALSACKDKPRAKASPWREAIRIVTF